MENGNQLTEILERIVRIETKIDGYNNLREKLDATSNRSINNENRLNKLENAFTWLWRTVGAIFIAGFIAASIKFI
jgi:hypothetical protein